MRIETVRIAIIAPPWLPVPPPGYGGTEVVLDGLARGLVDAGHEVLLIGHPDSKCRSSGWRSCPPKTRSRWVAPCPSSSTRSGPTPPPPTSTSSVITRQPVPWSR